jgi:SAM-dependent methyltransferase
MDKDTKQFYDLTAERTADEWYENNVLVSSIQDFVRLLPERPRVLDLGCGPGHESMRLASTGAQVIGVDFSTECIKVARERCPQCQFEVMDFRQLDGRFGQFDGVFACASLIHIEPGELPDVLEGIADVLKDKGYLLAIVRDGRGIRQSWPVVNGQEIRRVIHLYTRENLVSAASRFSFVREGYLALELLEGGWRSYVFRVDKE